MINSPINQLISVPAGEINLSGELIIPVNSQSLVIFSHGSGSSRFSTRNNFVARELHKQGIGTFLFDLLTKEEDMNYANRFNIELLSERLIVVTKYIRLLPAVSGLKIGYFGASTGAASALRAAAALPDIIDAVVSRGGRPDLAINIADKVKAPTLLIVGEKDYDVIEMNETAYQKLQCKKKMEIVPDATHLFEEPGTLEKAASLAADWFSAHLKLKEEKLVNY